MRSTNTGRWSDDEVDRLRRAVDDGLTWSEVATCVGTRDKTQCKSKWIQLVEKCSGQYGSIGGVMGSTWTEDEENVLLDLYNEYPGNWELISGVGQGRRESRVDDEYRSHYGRNPPPLPLPYQQKRQLTKRKEIEISFATDGF